MSDRQAEKVEQLTEQLRSAINEIERLAGENERLEAGADEVGKG